MTPISIASTVLIAACAVLLPAQGAPANDFQKTNALDAQRLNAQFATFKSTDSCTTSDPSCVGHDFAQCVDGKWVTTPCSSGTICVALPLVNTIGTSISCDVEADALARMEAAGVGASLTGSDGVATVSSSNELPSATLSDTTAFTSAPTPSPSTGDAGDSLDCDMDLEILAERGASPSASLIPYMRYRRQANPAFTPSPSSSLVSASATAPDTVSTTADTVSATVPGTVSTTAPDTDSVAAPDTVSTAVPDTVSTTAPDTVSATAPDTVSATAPDVVSTTAAVAVSVTAPDTASAATPVTVSTDVIVPTASSASAQGSFTSTASPSTTPPPSTDSDETTVTVSVYSVLVITITETVTPSTASASATPTSTVSSESAVNVGATTSASPSVATSASATAPERVPITIPIALLSGSSAFAVPFSTAVA